MIRSNAASPQSSSTSKFSKSDVRYWLAHVTHSGQGNSKSPNFSVRFSAHGKQRFVTLSALTKKEAAAEAKQLWIEVVANGWSAADHLVKKRIPISMGSKSPVHAKAPAGNITIQNLLECARSILVDVSPRSMTEYTRALRTIVSQSLKISKSGLGGMAKWREAVDQHDLFLLTPESIQAWVTMRIDVADANSTSPKRTIRTVLQNAQSLFGKKVLKELGEKYGVSYESPFTELSRPRTHTVRHLSKFEVAHLFKKARVELENGSPTQFEIWKIFLLTISAGLRRGELDRLLWRHVDLDRGYVHVTDEKGMKGKTQSSVGTIKLDSEVVDLIRQWPGKSPDEHVVPKAIHSRSRLYRAGQHFSNLIKWLRDYEVNGSFPLSSVQKPLHELRKEAGSRVNISHGLHAAKVFMRHSNIDTTSRFYLDSTPDYTAGIGEVIRPKMAPRKDVAVTSVEKIGEGRSTHLGALQIADNQWL